MDRVIIYSVRIDIDFKINLMDNDNIGGGEPYTFEATTSKKDLFRIAI